MHACKGKYNMAKETVIYIKLKHIIYSKARVLSCARRWNSHCHKGCHMELQVTAIQGTWLALLRDGKGQYM